MTVLAPLPVQIIVQETSDLRKALLEHPVYERISDMTSLRVFMQHHAFAVLDFMWLLKRLQRELTGIAVPWLPSQNPRLTRFINEIVLGEESDEDGQGSFCSHFELYLRGMEDVGASQSSMRIFLTGVRDGSGIPQALTEAAVPVSVRRFVTFNADLAATGTAGQVASAFCFGREDIIPEMFQRLLSNFRRNGIEVPRLQFYIERHIELDGQHHGPLSHQMVSHLCRSETEVEAAICTAREALQMRISLWDGVLSELDH